MSSNKGKRFDLSGNLSSLGGLELGFQVHERVLKWSMYLALEIALIGVLFLLLIKPRWQKNVSLRKATDNRSSEVVKMQEKLARLDDFAVKYASDFDLIEKIVPQDENWGVVMMGIREVARESGVEVIDYSIERSSGGESKNEVKGLNRYYLQINVSGSAVEIKRFMSIINTSIPLVSVENFRVSEPRSEGSLATNLRANLNIAVFYLPKELVNVSASGALKPISESDRELLDELRTYQVWEVDSAKSGGKTLRNDNLFGL